MHLAAAGDAQLLARARQADHGQDPEALERRELLVALQRGAVEGHEEVDGDGVGVQVAEREDGLDELLVRLPHARDQAAAGGQAGGAGALHGVHALLVGVGGADGLVVGLGRVEVVVVGVDAGVLELLGLAVLEEAEARAHLDVRVLGLEVADHAGHAVDVAVRGAGARGDHAHARGAAGDAQARLADGLLRLEPRVAQDLGLGAEPLGAVGAVLRAEAGLEADQVVDLDGAAEVLLAQARGRRDDAERVRVRGVQHSDGLLSGKHVARLDAVHEGLGVEGGGGAGVDGGGVLGGGHAGLSGGRGSAPGGSDPRDSNSVH